MSLNDYSSLILDLDGTLIGRDELISPRVFEAVRKAMNYLNVSVATGREPSDAIRFARELGLTTPQVSDNGALIVDPADGSEVWSSPLSPADAENIVRYLDEGGISLIATQPSETITSLAQVTDWNMTRVSALDIEESLADSVTMHFSSNKDLHVVKAFLPYNGLWAVDFTNVGITKATALHKLGELSDSHPSKMIAAGDGYNDRQMLEVCGLSIVMGDAPDELKAIADYVAPSVDEDGLAVAIEEFILPKLVL